MARLRLSRSARPLARLDAAHVGALTEVIGVAKDSVCGMDVDERKASVTSQYPRITNAGRGVLGQINALSHPGRPLLWYWMHRLPRPAGEAFSS